LEYLLNPFDAFVYDCAVIFKVVGEMRRDFLDDAVADDFGLCFVEVGYFLALEIELRNLDGVEFFLECMDGRCKFARFN
jgi:hypothetical protein